MPDSADIGCRLKDVSLVQAVDRYPYRENHPGDFPLMQVINDMPVLDTFTRKGGFIPIRMNDLHKANPEQYTSLPGSKSTITIQDLTDTVVKGRFNALLQCVTNSTKKISMTGSFTILR